MSALDNQVDGDHYKNLAIQPAEYIRANKLQFHEGCIVKYITRWKDKGGLKDLQKVKHFVDMIIEQDKLEPTERGLIEEAHNRAEYELYLKMAQLQQHPPGSWRSI